MANIYKEGVKSLEKMLNEKNKFTELLDKVEKMTNVKKIYIVQGVLGIFSIYMILGHFAELVCNLVGFVYPAYRSIAALESPNKDDDTKWLTYWVVYATFSVFEFFSDILFSWFPLYWLAKVIFLVWCFLPITNGSMFVYNKVIRPLFMKNRNKLESVIQSAASDVAGFASKTLNEAQKISKSE